MPISILGVGAADSWASAADMYSDRELPWLQDTTAADWWGKLSIAYRDVLIVDPSGERFDVYNLTENNLGDSANYEALTERLRSAASVTP